MLSSDEFEELVRIREREYARSCHNRRNRLDVLREELDELVKVYRKFSKGDSNRRVVSARMYELRVEIDNLIESGGTKAKPITNYVLYTGICIDKDGQRYLTKTYADYKKCLKERNRIVNFLLKHGKTEQQPVKLKDFPIQKNEF